MTYKIEYWGYPYPGIVLKQLCGLDQIITSLGSLNFTLKSDNLNVDKWIGKLPLIEERYKKKIIRIHYSIFKTYASASKGTPYRYFIQVLVSKKQAMKQSLLHLYKWFLFSLSELGISISNRFTLLIFPTRT